MNTKDFSLRFIDIMVGIVLSLGFQWWTSLHEFWQYAAFIFVYIDIIDYWIDYGPSLKKYPPKKEIDLFLDVVVMFNLFLYIFSTQKETSFYFLISFAVLRLLDILWIRRVIKEYPHERLNIKKWLTFNLIEAAVGAVVVIFVFLNPNIHIIAGGFIVLFWICMRIYIALRYKRSYLI